MGLSVQGQYWIVFDPPSDAYRAKPSEITRNCWGLASACEKAASDDYKGRHPVIWSERRRAQYDALRRIRAWRHLRRIWREAGATP